MGVHHAWGRTLKDAVIRFHAMQGQSCRYQNGFDCQGLWVEVEVERALGFKGKPDIEAFGLANFSRACRERVDEFAGVIAEQSTRLGQWMDWDNSYFTYTDDNIEAIWLFLQKCFERSYLYEGHVPLPWCTRCGTSLSQHEMLGSYVDTEDLSLYVSANLLDGSDRALVLWTTTPWTLPANVAAAVQPALTYEEIEWEGRRLVLSAGARRRLGLADATVQRELRGAELIGLEFETFFPDLPAQSGIAHVVIPWEEIDAEEGSGIVHIAPGCGPEDYELAKELGLGVIAPLDSTGDYVDGFDWLTGRNAATVADDITARLRNAARVVKDELYAHSVPVCWRCKSHVLFRLVDEWFISVAEVREPMLAASAHGELGTVAHRQPDGRLAAQHGRLVHLAEAVLGPAAPLLPLRGVQRAHGRGFARRAARACNRPDPRRRPARAPPTVDRRHQDLVCVVRRAGGACPRGRRLLARRGHRPLLDARLLRRSRRLEGALPRRVDQRDPRAGPPLVLLDALHERRARSAAHRTSAR